MSSYANLEHIRAGHLGGVTKIQTFITEFDSQFSTVSEIKGRRTLLERIYSNHEDVINKLYTHNDANLEKIAEDVDKFQAAYCVALGLIEDKLESLQPPPSSMPPIVTPIVPIVQATERQRMHVKLPVITLPVFDGSFEKWLQFRDTFESMIHKNESLDNIQKFQYLISSFKLPSGQANVLDSFSPTEALYQDAWTAVKERYDDKKKLKQQHFTNLLTIKKMTSESPAELRRILDSFSSNITTLTQLGATWDNLLVHVVQFRMEDQTLKDWQKHIGNEEGTWNQIREFLKSQWRIMDQLPVSKKPASKTGESKPVPHTQITKSHTASAANDFTCSLCKENHRLYQCPKFKSMSPSDRYNHIKAAKLCRNCFSPQHIAQACKNLNRCRTCQQDHHTMIHFEKPFSSSAQAPQGSAAQSPQPRFDPQRSQPQMQQPKENFQPYSSPTNNAHSTSFYSTKSFAVSKQSLLSTITFDVMDINGEFQSCRALLDSGSEDHYITCQFVHKLGLELVGTFVTVTGISEKTTIIRHKAYANIRSTYGPYGQNGIECLVLPNITGLIPGRPINVNKLSIPPECILADPGFHTPAECDMLIGNEFFLDLLLAEVIKLPEGVHMKHTKFGWIFGGRVAVSSPARTTSLLSCFTRRCHVGVEEVDAKLEKFMEIESCGTSEKLLSAEEQFVETLYQQTTKKDVNGRFIVQLPCKTTIDQLGNNFNNARRQFFHQEKLRQQDDELNALYVDYMEEYISSKHMEEVDPSLQHEGYYLPQHGVKKVSSTTTKLRPVSNASCKSETGLSLNECLCVGPTVQSELFDILIRFREKPFVIKADIEKMYRQIFIDPSMRKYQKVLWRSKPSDQLKHYQLNGCVFGIAPSAYLSTRSLLQVAHDNEKIFPLAAQIIRDSFYVDDLMFGCDSITLGLELRNQLRYLLSSSCLPTRKFASNDKALLENLQPHELEDIEDENSAIKTLGINWFPNRDHLSLSFKSANTELCTKASVLSEIASVYDPIGIVGPVIFKAKVFMKILWKLNLKWNDQLPAKENQQWDEFRAHISLLNDVYVDRHAVISNPVRVEVHGFGDASEDGYGVAVYIRSLDAIGNIQVTLLCSKSRVSPPKQKSIARLELCAGVLLSKLMTRIIRTLSLLPSEVILWSDSMIVLYWILTQSSKLSVFVGNRVAVIQELTTRFVWKHIRGESNPADPISRGLLPEEIQNCELWWNGPSFFMLPTNQWPQSLISINEQDPDYAIEVRKCLTLNKIDSLFVGIETRVSRLSVLINAYARCHRALKNAKKDTIKIFGPFTVEERDEAMLSIVRIVQRAMFPKEFEYFIKKCQEPSLQIEFPSKSQLHQLAPTMTKKEQVIRVGGRLQASPGLTDNQKHPIVLPSCNFAKLIVRDLHNRHHHPGNLAMLAIVRENYWPIGAKSIIKRVKYECLVCFRAKPPLGTQFMGSLPEARVTMTPTFSATAVDYAGYFNLRSSLTHKKTVIKAWVAMFKCMSTGAIHLEAVTSLSTEAFIAAFDRFISRRGLSSDIFSDNGTNFVGADNEFKKILKEVEPKIAAHLSEKSIKWHFTCPLAPHAGGYYESGIKTMKHHLVRIMADRSFDYEQFTTVLCKIEAIINSRPLTPMSDDPSDLKFLTPAHFLTGRMLIAKPERNFIPVKENRLDRWNQLQQIQQKFWDSWYHDYLHHLQTRPIKFREKKEYHVGDMVLIKDNNLPPLKWIIGRISEVFPGKDKVIRNVRVRCIKEGKPHHLDRDVRYLCLLPLEETSSAAPERVANAND